jgi:hypothetical protein
MNQMDLTDIYRIFYPTTSECTLFSAVQRNFSKVDHILGCKAILNKDRKTEITSSNLSDHNGI